VSKDNQELTVEENGKKSFLSQIHFEKNELIVLFSIFFIGISSAMFAPYAPIWLKEIFSVESYFILGFVAIIPNFMIAVGTTVWGIFADKLGNKPFIILGIGSISVMYFVLIFINNPYAFLAVMLVGYVFISAQTSNIYSFATLNISKKKETILGEITVSFSAAWLIASPLAGLIHDNAETSPIIQTIIAFLSQLFSSSFNENSSQLIQLVIAIFASFIAFILILFAKEKNKPKQLSITEKQEKENKITNYVAVFVLIMFIAFFQQATSGGFWSFASLYFIDELGVQGVQFSFFLIATTAIALIISPLLGKISKIKKVAICVIGGMVIQVIIYFLMSLFPRNSVLSLVVYSFPMYVVFNISLYSIVGTFSNKSRRSTAYGLFNTLGIAGSISATLLMGLIGDASSEGIFNMLWFALALALVSFILSLFLFFVISRYTGEESL